MVLPSLPSRHLAWAAFSEALRACLLDRCGSIFSFFDHRPHDFGLRSRGKLDTMAARHRHLPIRWAYDRRFRRLALDPLAPVLASSAVAPCRNRYPRTHRALRFTLALAERAIRFRTG